MNAVRQEYTLLDGRVLAHVRHIVDVDTSDTNPLGLVDWSECTIDGQPSTPEELRQELRQLVIEYWTKRVLENARLKRDAAGLRFDVC